MLYTDTVVPVKVCKITIKPLATVESCYCHTKLKLHIIMLTTIFKILVTSYYNFITVNKNVYYYKALIIKRHQYLQLSCFN